MAQFVLNISRGPRICAPPLRDSRVRVHVAQSRWRFGLRRGLRTVGKQWSQ